MEACGKTNAGSAERAEPSATRTDRQWVGDEIGRRIVAAAREAVALHLDAAVREGLTASGPVAVERTQAASLALLAERVRRERSVDAAVAGGVAS